MKMLSNLHPKKISGFAIIEAIITCIILSVGILALFTFQNATLQNNSDAKIRAEATALAESKLEELRSFLTTTDSRLNNGTTVGTGADATFNNALAATLTRTWTVSGTNLKIAVVRVGWVDRDGIQQYSEVSSNISFDDPALAGAIIAQVIASGGGTRTGGSYIPGNLSSSSSSSSRGSTSNNLPSSSSSSGGSSNGMVSTYTAIVAGTIDIASSADLTTFAIANNPVIDTSSRSYQPKCTFYVAGSEINISTTDPDSYSCELTYTTVAQGWIGTITFTSNRIFCSNPSHTDTAIGTNGKTLVQTHAGILTGPALTRNLVIKSTARQC